tara:strand:- start:327 stop:1361 length:1035 start_codon:yes stop_codon:yes gene_type:complete
LAKSQRPILITGVAGFIGFSVARGLLKKGSNVVGIDNLNPYYDPKLKESRLKNIYKLQENKENTLKFYKNDIENKLLLEEIFKKHNPKYVINLAAQAGVRYSLINPDLYLRTNILGFGNIIECCRKFDVEHLIYASSSSVYGGNSNLPYKESSPVDHPISLYAATKKSNEVIAHSYSNLYNIPTTGLRYFTVYGPWGRPDMAPMIFTKAILEGEPIKIFNFGNMVRDFTYIDDIVEATIKCCNKPSTPNIQYNPLSPDPSTSNAPFRIFNVGNHKKVKLLDFISLIEENLGKNAIKDFQDLEPGDMIETFSENNSLNEWIDYHPNTSLERGIKNFIKWYLDYYK